jgi:hypothetical protein
LNGIITPKEITVKANGGSSIYGNNPVNPNFTAIGLVDGETESVLTGLSNSFGIDGTTPVGTYVLQVIGTLTNANYTVTADDSAEWIVNKRPLTVKANDETIEFGETPKLTYSIISGNLVNGDALSGVLYVDNYNIGTHVISQGTLTADSNYDLTFLDGTLTVLPPGNVEIDKILVDGKTAQRNGDQFFIVSECGMNQAEVSVVCTPPYASVKINGIAQNPCSVALPKYGSNSVIINTISPDGTPKTYTLTIYKEIPFDQVVKMRWNNTLTVINNPANNGGFTFTSFKWFRNGQDISIDQSWSASPNGDWINPDDEFYVELTAEGYSEKLRNCKSKIVLRHLMKAYPNPVAKGQTLYLETDMSEEQLQDAVIEVYNSVGSLVETLQPTLPRIPISNRYATGVYVFILKGKDGFREAMKVVIY